VLKEIHITNYRCALDVVIPLEPLTVLVGPNGSGKSTVLSALAGQMRGPADTFQRKGGSSSIVAMTAQGEVSHWSVQILRLDVEALRRINLANKETKLSLAGENLTNVFATLTRKQKETLAEQFCALVPTFRDVDDDKVGQGQLQIRFQDRWNENVWYEAHEVSDGTMLALAFLLLRFQKPLPQIVCIEDFDHGLHPYLVGELIRLLTSMTGPELQVILTTHSAELLEHVEPDQVRFLDRDEKTGAMTVHRVRTSDPDWERAYAEYERSLGDVWLSGALGGVPGGSAH